MTDPSPLTPPDTAAAASLALTPPDPVAAVAPEKVAGMVPLDQAAVPGLDAKVTDYVDSILALDHHSPEFGEKADDIRTMGDDDLRASAETSNRLLDAPVRAMRSGSEGKVAKTLVELRRTVEDLDPAEATGTKKLLGMIPFGDKLRDYFRRYESAQSHLDAIVTALYDGADELRKDNVALEQEKGQLWETMQRLAQYSYLASQLDATLVARIAAVEATDPDKAKALRDDVLFYVRQKHQDLLTQLAVSIQGYLAIDLVKRNNLELIKGVDRATTTTLSALRTAVVVAQALSNQKLVLDQIRALNTTTSSMITATSELLATQGVDIHKQAASTTVELDALKSAFSNLYGAMDAIDTYRSEALTTMSTTVTSLQGEIDKAQAYLARVKPDEPGADPDPSDLELPGR